MIKKQLDNFFLTVKADLGKVYALSSVHTMRSAIVQHLRQQGTHRTMIMMAEIALAIGST